MKIVPNLEIKQLEDGGRQYVCKKCGTILFTIYNNKTYEIGSSCPHFSWWEVTKAYYYLGIGAENKKELEHLRKDAVIRINKPESMFVYVLVSEKN